MPGYRFTLSVFVRCQVYLRSFFERRLELLDLVLLLPRHDVKRLEIVFHIDAQLGPGLLAVGGRDLRRIPGQVADMADRRLDYVPGAKETGDRARLGGGLNND